VAGAAGLPFVRALCLLLAATSAALMSTHFHCLTRGKSGKMGNRTGDPGARECVTQGAGQDEGFHPAPKDFL
jgi:hypothetical protein